MVIVMEKAASEEQVSNVIEKLVRLGFDVHRSTGVEHTVLGAVGGRVIEPSDLEMLEGVERVVRITSPYKRASRTFKPEDTVVRVGEVEVGARDVIVIAGPPLVEGPEQIEAIARLVAENGAQGLTGGISAGSAASGGELDKKLLQSLVDAARRNGLIVAVDVADPTHLTAIAAEADLVIIAARNMQNTALLREAGRMGKPVLLKRGRAATVEELLLAAESIMEAGNPQVILCESGIRTFESYLRSTFDVSAIPIIEKLSHLPVVADPSRASGRRDKVGPLAQAAIAAGADGVLLEVHVDPESAAGDCAAALRPDQFAVLMNRIRDIARAVDRSPARAPADSALGR